MKIKSLIALGVAAAALTACSGNGARTPADNTAAAQADSLMTCFGQMRGVEYKREAQRDSSLLTPEAVKQYMAGIQAGLKAVKNDNEAYNRGFTLGMQMAMNIQQFEKDYGVKLSDRAFTEGVAEVVKSDSAYDGSKLQREFYRLMGDFNERKQERDKAEAAESLKAAAQAKGLKEITAELYGNVPASQGERIKEGDKVQLRFTLTGEDGKPIPAPLPNQITVGERMKESPLTDALTSMASGQTADFMTTAHALFGPRCAQMRLEPKSVLTLQLTPTLEETPAE